MKIAIYKDTTSEFVFYYSYKYNWFLRLFGPSFSRHIELSTSISDLMIKTKRKLAGTTAFIEVVNI